MTTMLDYINAAIAYEQERGKKLTYDEWCRIRRTGTPEEIEEAVERMEAAGGYDNLER